MSAAGCAASCAVGCLGSLACCAASKGNTSDYRIAKTMAFLFQVTAVVLIMVVQSTDMSSWLGKVPGIKACDTDVACYSQQVAYRVGFAASCVFVFHLILSLGSCCANMVLNSYWVFKFLFLFGGSALMMLIPNAFFTVWASVASVALGWFLLVQMVWVLDFGYSWNDLWISNARDDKLAGKSGKSWYIGILGLSVVFLTAAYVWFGMTIRDYASQNSNRTILWVNLSVSTLLAIVSLFAPRGGILPASLNILYIAWLSWSICWSGDSTTITSDSRLAISMTLAFVILLWATVRTDLPQVTAAPSSQTAPVPVQASEATPAVPGTALAPVQEDIERGPSNLPKKSESKPSVGSWKAIVFLNLMHLSAACYLMSLCLSWKNSVGGPENMIFYWVQAVAGLVMLTLYGWTLIAPAICKSRQF
jgi:hypothetical protein